MRAGTRPRRPLYGGRQNTHDVTEEWRHSEVRPVLVSSRHCQTKLLRGAPADTRGPRNDQSLLGTRDRDVEEPPLLVVVFRVRTGVFLPPLAGERFPAHAKDVDVLSRYPLRQALPTHGQAAAGRGAPHDRDDDVRRDGHAVLAGAGGGGTRGTCLAGS